MDAEETLRRVPLFKNLDPSHVKQLAKWSTTRSYDAGQTLVQQGAVGMGLYCIGSGRVRVVREEASGPRETRTMGPGETFGELALLADQPRSATITAIEPTTAVLLDKAQFMAELRAHPEIALAILPVLATWLAEERS